MNFTAEKLKELLDGQEFQDLVHASKILTKLNNKENVDWLLKCAPKYYEFHSRFNMSNFENSVEAWNKYLKFVRVNNKTTNGKYVFPPQSKFESTILREVLYRMFQNYVSDKIKIGGMRSSMPISFSPFDFNDFKEKSNVKINTKDQNFAIYKQVEIAVGDTKQKGDEMQSLKAYIPVVAIECKTYLDKTMLEGSIATAEKIKNGNPYCRFCIVTERYEVDRNVDVKHSRIDQIYVLKKDLKKRDATGIFAINKDVVELLYNDTLEHLNRKWSDVEENIRTKGIVL